MRQLKDSLFNEYRIVANHKKIRRVMRDRGLICKVRRAKVSRKAENMVIKENILSRNFDAQEPNKSLVTDFTYLNIGGNTYYLSVVLDLFDNKPLVWYLTDKSDKSLSLNTLTLLSEKVDLRNCMLHSDQGIQYSCKAFCEALERSQVIQSMSRRGNCWDNAVIENFFGILKTECLYPNPARCRTLSSVIELIEEEMEYYTNERPQKSLGGIPPRDYRNNYFAQAKN